jgi:glycogen debranching enzyme
MNRLDHGKFSYEINKIISASREDLMWKGTISNHSEISSAERQIAQGAVSQAWSFATYIEAMYEILKIDNYSWF